MSRQIGGRGGDGGGVPTLFLPMGKCIFSYFFPLFAMGKMGKKVYGKRGKSTNFPLFPYTFFPWRKMGKDTFFTWAKMELDSPRQIQNQRYNTVSVPTIYIAQET